MVGSSHHFSRALARGEQLLSQFDERGPNRGQLLDDLIDRVVSAWHL
jgi:hypothetical protein